MKSQHVHHDHSRLYRYGIEAGLLTIALVLLGFGLTQWRAPLAQPNAPVTARVIPAPDLKFNPGTGSVYDGAAHPIPNFGRAEAPDLGFYPGAGSVYDGAPHPMTLPVPQSAIERILGFDPGAGSVYGEPAQPVQRPEGAVVPGLGFNPGTGTVYDGVAHPIRRPEAAPVAGLGFNPGTGTVYGPAPRARQPEIVRILGFNPGTGTVYDGAPHPTDMEDSLAR